MPPEPTVGIHLGGLAEINQLAVALVVHAHSGVPLEQADPPLEAIPAAALRELVISLLVFTRLAESQSRSRAAQEPGTASSFDIGSPPSLVRLSGGEQEHKHLTADLLELLEGWMSDDPSTTALAERYASRWQHAGAYQLALAGAALLPAGRDAAPTLRWTVDAMRSLQNAQPPR